MSKKITVELSEETYNSLKTQIEEKEKELKGKPKKLQIKNRWTGDVIYESEKTTYKDILEEAVAEGADLRGAYLRGANLEGANLEGAYLKKVDFYRVLFYGRTNDNSKKTKITKSQINDFLDALGVQII